MSLRSQIISRLVKDRSSRESYLRAKLNQIIPSQIKALRLKMPWTQKELGCEADMKQARISAMEKPGETAFTLETLIRLASAFRVGLKVEFVPFSEMVRWEDKYSQDSFSATPIEKDEAFLNPHIPPLFPISNNSYTPIKVLASIVQNVGKIPPAIDARSGIPISLKTERLKQELIA